MTAPAGKGQARQALVEYGLDHGWESSPGRFDPTGSTYLERGSQKILLSWHPGGSLKSATLYQDGRTMAEAPKSDQARRRKVERWIRSFDTGSQTGLGWSHQPRTRGTTPMNANTTTTTTEAILIQAAKAGKNVRGTGPAVKAAKAAAVQEAVGVKNVTYVATASDGTVLSRTSASMVYTHMVAVVHPDGGRTGQFAWTGGGYAGIVSQAQNARKYNPGTTVEILPVTPMTAKDAKALGA